MPARTFWWVSQLGMLPLNFIYVNAGTELGTAASPRELVSPGLLLSLALVAMTPLVARRVVRARREIDLGIGCGGRESVARHQPGCDR
jgi:uncharacterized membrane protein YdjX (TVP38/TMEM64 family)